ncbi:hypothetical protein Bbelb_303150 [Branchiostoma belcheri]|nr:hypothetical protein Bbelb_303150 [Branchiostoma belcheri]
MASFRPAGKGCLALDRIKRKCYIQTGLDAPGSPLDPARDLTAARPNCKSRSAPYRKPHGSSRETDRAPDGSLTETGRQGDQNRRTLGVMTPAGVYTEDMPNGRRQPHRPREHHVTVT